MIWAVLTQPSGLRELDATPSAKSEPTRLAALAKMFQQRQRTREFVPPFLQQLLAADSVDGHGRQKIPQPARGIGIERQHAAPGTLREVPKYLGISTCCGIRSVV